MRESKKSEGGAFKAPPPGSYRVKGTDQTGTFMSLKCAVYYANYRSGHQSSKIQVVP